MEKRGSGLRKICDLSAQLDGYNAELCPEFMSEANVFYTIIKNVNYPTKEEVGGVNKGVQMLIGGVWEIIISFLGGYLWRKEKSIKRGIMGKNSIVL